MNLDNHDSEDCVARKGVCWGESFPETQSRNVLLHIQLTRGRLVNGLKVRVIKVLRKPLGVIVITIHSVLRKSFHCSRRRASELLDRRRQTSRAALRIDPSERGCIEEPAISDQVAAVPNVRDANHAILGIKISEAIKHASVISVFA